MKLIKFEAKGFKSFADKIVLHFNGNIVGIAGPNGSGKSNINDAIK
jgi:chromosome segregation protein